MQVSQEQEEGQSEVKEEEKKETDEGKCSSGGGESSAMQQNELAKAALIQGKERLYEKGGIDQLSSCLISLEILNFENLFCQPIIPTILRAKLYDLLIALIQLGETQIIQGIHQSKILNYILIDYDKYENNSNLLILINKLVTVILDSKGDLVTKLIGDLNLLSYFRKKLESPDYLLG